MSDSFQLTFPLPYQRSYSFHKIELPFRLELNPEFQTSPDTSRFEKGVFDSFIEMIYPQLSLDFFHFSSLWRHPGDQANWQVKHFEEAPPPLQNEGERLGWEVQTDNVLILFRGAYRMGQP